MIPSRPPTWIIEITSLHELGGTGQEKPGAIEVRGKLRISIALTLLDPASAPENPVQQQAAQVHGCRTGRCHVHDARVVSSAGDQGRARR